MLKKIFRYQYSMKDEEQISKMKWNIACKHEFLSLNSVALHTFTIIQIQLYEESVSRYINNNPQKAWMFTMSLELWRSQEKVVTWFLYYTT